MSSAFKATSSREATLSSSGKRWLTSSGRGGRTASTALEGLAEFRSSKSLASSESLHSHKSPSQFSWSHPFPINALSLTKETADYRLEFSLLCNSVTCKIRLLFIFKWNCSATGEKFLSGQQQKLSEHLCTRWVGNLEPLVHHFLFPKFCSATRNNNQAQCIPYFD